MKSSTLWIIGILVVALIGFWWWQHSGSATTGVPEQTTEMMSDTAEENGGTTESTTTEAPDSMGSTSLHDEGMSPGKGGDSLDTSESSESTVAPKGAVVTLDTTGFTPNILTISKGTTVTFENKGGGPMWVATAVHPTHTAYDSTNTKQHCDPGYSGPAPFDQCGNGDTYSFTFDAAGVWKYHNHLKAPEVGTIIVE